MFCLGFNVNSNKNNLDISQNSGDVSSEQFSNLSLGNGHSGVVINDDEGVDHLYMWGRGHEGQLGNNSEDSSYVPIEIDPDGTKNKDGTPDGIQGTITNLSLGDNNSGVVINDDEGVDHLYMWGDNTFGKLGNGSTTNSLVPIEINIDKKAPGGNALGIQGTITNLSLGVNHSGVVINDDEGIDHLYMWGSNINGQLGVGTKDEYSNVPIEIDPDGNLDGIPDGIQGTVTNLSLGNSHSGVVINDNNGIDHLYMWGRNNYGQLGNNSTTNSNAPIEIDPDGNPNGIPDGIQGTITNFSLGDFHSGVVINDNNGVDHLYMWGVNGAGQLGNNLTANSHVPIEIDPDGNPNEIPDGIQGTITNLSLGSGFSGIVINDDEEVDHLYMWGYNKYGQLGNGTTINSSPIEIDPDGTSNSDKITPDGIQGTITNLSLGEFYSGVVINDNNGVDHLYMWGRNNYGQFGNGSTTNSLVPIKIMPPLIIGETIINSIPTDGKKEVIINWNWELNSSTKIVELELVGTSVDGKLGSSVNLLNDDNSNFENGSYSIDLEYGTYDDWQINYSTDLWSGTADIESFYLIKNKLSILIIIGIVFGVLLLIGIVIIAIYFYSTHYFYTARKK